MARVFVIDDEASMAQLIRELLQDEGHEVFTFDDCGQAIEALNEYHPELVITDLSLGQSPTRGLDVLRNARSLTPPAEVILVTAFGSIGTAVDAMKQGAYDYLEKPFKLDQFNLCAQRALAFSRAIAENHYLKKQLQDRYQFSQLIGHSPRMQAVIRVLERVVDTDSTVLILGESGTGKELVARTLHFNSRRQSAPFVPINCAALPEHLLESELFGHRKGAFPEAANDKKGLLAEADGGTLFLDEIGSMPMPVQSRLLRVLQDGEVKRVGDNTPSHVNVRVLAATHESLQTRIADGTFRKDLFYRLNVIPIELPTLRERREDIPVLVAHCLRNKVSPRTGCVFQITRRAVQALAAYDWPGNVRELENVIERAMTLCEQDLIRVADLPQTIQENAPETSRVPPGDIDETRFIMIADPALQAAPAETPDQESADPGASGTAAPERLREFLRIQEVNHVNRMLAYTRGDKEKAAHLLGISLATLYRKLAGDPV